MAQLQLLLLLLLPPGQAKAVTTKVLTEGCRNHFLPRNRY